MVLQLVTVLANAIYISKKRNNDILTFLLFRRAKQSLTKKQQIYLYIKLSIVKEDTDIYRLLNTWIENHEVNIIRQLLYSE